MSKKFGRRIQLLVAGVFFFIWACGGGGPQITLSVDQDKPIITITDPYLASPLQIIGTDQGMLYYETKSGKKWVSGTPASSRQTGDTLHAEWQANGRHILVDIYAEEGKIQEFGGRQYAFTFTAEPDTGISGWGFAIDATPEEYFTGLFERTVDGDQDNSWAKGITEAMNLRGQSVDMIIKPTLGLYNPFYISSRGYGLFTKGTWPGKYDFANAADDRVQISFEGSSFQSILYTAPEPASLVRAHSLHTGPTLVPPKWVFGHWYWRNNHYNEETYYDGTPVNAPYNSMLVEDLLMMEALDIPCAVYWVDRPWATGPFGYDDFEWDRERLPNPVEMVDWVHQKGMKFLLWTAPWVMGDMAQEALEQEYLLPSQMMTAIGIADASQVNDLTFLRGEFTRKTIETIRQMSADNIEDISDYLLDRDIDEDDESAVAEVRNYLVATIRDAESLADFHELILQFSGGRVLVDFTNPEARSWWQDQGIRKVLEDGVDGFKMDRSEEIVPQTREVVAHDGRTTRELRNDYPVEYVKTAYETAKEIHGDDFVLLPRAGYTGSPRYGVFWGGDINPPPEGLRAAIIAQLRSAIIGYPIWGSDTGGYDDPDDREVVAWWLAFSCFSPIMEVGPLDDRGLWDFPDEPHYDAELIAIWRTYAILHTNLADYSYEHAQTAHETGMPIARPLFLEYPEQQEAWNDWQTFLYGDDILVSAIWQKGTTEHSLYLPAGEQWINAWNTEEILSGGQTITVGTPLHKIPIFIRQGSDADLDDLQGLYEESLTIAKEQPDLKQLETQEFRQ